MQDLTEDALVASCPGDVGLVSWVNYRMSERIKELESQLLKVNQREFTEDDVKRIFQKSWGMMDGGQVLTKELNEFITASPLN